MRVGFLCISFLFACALSMTPPLAAQTPNGTINGLVLDPSNNVIGRADILVINDATGAKYSGKTNEDGIYVVPNLPPGAYRLQVSKVGFKTLIKPDIVLNLQDALSINFTLPVGAVFESVTVEGGASMVNTTDASVSTVVDQSYVKNMPLNGRSFQDLILLTPGVVTQTPQTGLGLGQTGEFSVNGQRTESNSYSVDGVSANLGVATGQGVGFQAGASGSLPGATALGTTQALVSVDTLQEFRVQSSTYSAEYGRNPGGQFAFETKSGANQWHGTAYDYLRNGFFDAQDWFNDYFAKTSPPLRQNDFGGTVGGPVRISHLYNGRDKTFFFVSYEGLQLVAPQAATASYVPDLCMRGMGNCPSGRKPASGTLLQALNAFPVPSATGIDDAVNGVAQYIGSWANPASLNSTSVRFDHSLNDKFRLLFRFADTTSNSGNRAQFPVPPSVNQISAYEMQTYTAGLDGALTNRLNNVFRLNYGSNETTLNQSIDAFGGSTPVNPAQMSALNPGAFLAISLSYGGYFPSLSQQKAAGAQRQWNMVDTVSLSSGRHQFKVGVDYRRLAPVVIQATPFLAYVYLSESAVESNEAFLVLQSYAPAHPLYKNFSAFAQDEWRLSSRLSVSVGLRWELNPAPSVTQGAKPYTLEGSNPATWTLAPQGTSLWQTTWFNFAPRLGFAYILHGAPGAETVVRGGGGIFFDTGQQEGSQSFLGPGFSAIAAQFGSFPVDAVGLVPPVVNPPVAPYNTDVYGFSPHLQLPYTLQWNASVEQALGRSQALTVSYVGSHAARLLQENQFSPANNPNLGSAWLIENGLTSDYNSLQAQFRRRFSGGFTSLASYTLSHCVDFGSSNYSIGYQRGSCDFDLRNNLSLAFSYDLPYVEHNRLLGALLNNWGVDDRFTARTGFPVFLYGNRLLQPDGQNFWGGLDFVPGQPVYLYGTNCAAVLRGIGDLQPGQGCPGGRAINPNAFTAATSGFGDAPRNFVRGFGIWQMDLSIRRDLPIYKRLKLQFRAEAFNVFNHPNLGTINPNFGQATFGQATRSLASSSGVLNPLYQMGGPRSMQFALKLVF